MDRRAPAAIGRRDEHCHGRSERGSCRRAPGSGTVCPGAELTSHSARRPATQASRLWVQSLGSSSQIPESGSLQRASMASAAISAAFHPVESRRPFEAARAKSNNASPKMSNWNSSRTWRLPTTSVPPG